jgi:TrmH family RNA methyltransferase
VDQITSRANPKIKELRQLREKRARQEQGRFLVEGIRPVGEAVEAGAALDLLIYAPDSLRSEYGQQLVADLTGRGVPCLAVSADVLASLAEKDNPQGLLAAVRTPTPQLADYAPVNLAWAVAAVAPQDPGNVGTILRTLDAVGADALILLDSQVDAYHPAAVRASMGTIFWHPVITASFAEFAAWAAQHQYHVHGTSAHAAQDARTVANFPRPRVLLLGSEREGLTDAQLAVCETRLRLPMLGHATSLNLAVAAGVLLYAMLERPAELELDK